MDLVEDKKSGKDLVGVPLSSLGISGCCCNMNVYFLKTAQTELWKKARYLRQDFAISFD